MKMTAESFAGIYREVANNIGVENTVKLYEAFKGQQIVFPQRLYSKEYVNNYILENYNGSNLKEIGRTLGYSDRRIRQLLSELRDEKDVAEN